MKMILTDLDETLLYSDKTISSYTIEIFNRCKEKGFLVGFCTSRGKVNIKPFLEKYKLDFVIITYSNGEIDITNIKTKVYTHKDIIELGKHNKFINVPMSRDDDGTILYTSGTTGNPKGVVLSHANTIYQIEVVHEGFLAQPGEKTLQILPIWHSYERVGQCYYISRGCNLHYTTLTGLKNDLATYDIDTFMSVPRIWESIRTGVYQKLKQVSPIMYNIFDF